MPLNDDYVPDKKELAIGWYMAHAELVAQIGMTLALAISFTVLGTPLVALGIVLGLIVVLSIGLVR